MHRSNAQADPATPAPDSIQANCTLVCPVRSHSSAISKQINELMLCLTRTVDCQIRRSFLEVLNEILLYNHFSGSSSVPDDRSELGVLIKNIMQFTTTPRASRRACSSRSECQRGQPCVNSVCLDSMTHFHDAYSPGVEWENRAWRVVDESASIWTKTMYVARPFLTVSTITFMFPLTLRFLGISACFRILLLPLCFLYFSALNRARIFVARSQVYEGLALGFGLALTILSLLATVKFRKWTFEKFKQA